MRTKAQHVPPVIAGLVAVAAFTVICPAGGQDTADDEALAGAYESQIRPLLQRYCHDCHTGDEAEAEIDLTAFASMAHVRQQPRVWQKVATMLDSGQMPPPDADQPADAERAQLETWVRAFLTAEARARAGDPGPVVLRRLSNAEYTFTVRDLTGVDTLDPAREFPVDGAAGEGFTNTGNALGMSPSLVRKFLEAAKEIAQHAVLLPDGIRFSPHTTSRDWTDDTLADIRALYSKFTESGGGKKVNLQGLEFDTDQGGRLPLERYLAATLAERDALSHGRKTVAAVADERDLNAKYLGLLWRSLQNDKTKAPSLVLDRIRSQWRGTTAGNLGPLVAEIRDWQTALWKFNVIGHIGREDGPRAWMEPNTPIRPQQEFRLELPKSPAENEFVFYLAAGTAGDGDDGDYVVWKNPRLEGANRPAFALRDAAGLQQRIDEWRHQILSKTDRYLAAAAGATPELDLAELAKKQDLDERVLRAWLDYLAMGPTKPVEVSGHFTEKIAKSGNYDFVKGWGTADTPSIVANSSDQTVNIPGTTPPHSVVGHPSPSLFAAAGWQSPIDGLVAVEARVADAHPGCGNGQEWAVQHRTSRKTGNLWHGKFDAGGQAAMPAETISVRKGDLISFVLGPRDGNHSCDLAEFNLVITEINGGRRVWDLAKDVSDDILASNPHADSHGNEGVWHFYKGPVADALQSENLNQPVSVPAGSLLAQWQSEEDAVRRTALAQRVQALAVGPPPDMENSPDAVLYGQLQALAVNVDHEALFEGVKPDPRFGRHADGKAVDSVDLILKAPHVTEFHVPAELAAGRTLVVTGQLESQLGEEGSVQLQVATTRPDVDDLSPARPLVTVAGSTAHRRVEAAFAEFRDLFPAALCYARIVPIDEVVTLTLFYRQDEPLQRLMLDEQQITQLNRLWDELFFLSQEPLKYQVAFEQIREFATQDRPDLVEVWNPLVKSVNERADAFRERLADTEPAHVAAVVDFAQRAWRRQLTADEGQRLRETYAGLRQNQIPHDEAIRLTLARVLTAPAFLYRLEKSIPGDKPTPVSNEELANRLSYFLWSSLPDDELRCTAENGELSHEPVLLEQTRRMLQDPRTRRLAIQFACQWLHIRDFDQNDEKNEKLYPQFATLRGEMYEESVRFFEDMFRHDGSVLDLLDADHTFLNESLARHYGIDGVAGTEWRKVNGMRAKGRGGVLGMATVLASLSGASRTSPILRGNWVSETLLGERLPRPPANVPQLPDAVPNGLTAHS